MRRTTCAAAVALAVSATSAQADTDAHSRTASLYREPTGAAVLASPARPTPRRQSAFAAAIEAALADAPLEIRAAYGAVEHRALWGLARDPLEALGAPRDWSRAEVLLGRLEMADSHALPTARYRVETLREMLVALRARLAAPAHDEPAEAWDGPPATVSDPETLALAAALEIALSEVAVLYAGDLSSGALEPSDALSDVFVERQRPNGAVVLARLVTAADPNQALAAYEPSSRDYQLLRARYQGLLALDSGDGFGAPHEYTQSLRQGASGRDVASARRRLAALGYLPAGAGETEAFDAEMDAAVRRFQGENGILVDGEIGPVTTRTLNRTAAERARQIAVNMERARWHNYDLGARHIRVNIPDFHVELIQDGVTLLRSRTVVGTRKHQTPEFSDRMTHVVVNPMWHVPRSIATKELLPEIRENPDIIFQRNMRLVADGGVTVDPWSVDWSQMTRRNFPYRIQQLPGDGNALGDVKFIFPNRHAIYLHDTPAKSLFRKPLRTFSHGCVRVAEPAKLAELLLEPQRGAKAGRYYRRLRASGRERYVRLNAEVPVHLLYRTVWIDADGRTQTRRDIYGRDDRLAEAMVAAGVALP